MVRMRAGLALAGPEAAAARERGSRASEAYLARPPQPSVPTNPPDCASLPAFPSYAGRSACNVAPEVECAALRGTGIVSCLQPPQVATFRCCGGGWVERASGSAIDDCAAVTADAGGAGGAGGQAGEAGGSESAGGQAQAP